jgi:ubiquinone/menaquinone biosynthesis C-methylase UbiE
MVNLILWGNYNRLRSAVLEQFGRSLTGKTLQIACAYGDITPLMVDRMDATARLDVVDILPVQLGNLAAKIGSNPQVSLHCMDATDLAFDDARFDQVLSFFLLHEQPADVRRRTLAEAVRVLRLGGRLIVLDYSMPQWWNPMRYFWKPILKRLEPFAGDLFDQGLMAWLPQQPDLVIEKNQSCFGGLFQLVVMKRLPNKTIVD